MQYCKPVLTFGAGAMIVSLLICITAIALYQVLVHLGMGRHLWDVPVAMFSPHFLKLYLIASVFYSSSMLSIKIAIMLLYRRLFPIQNFMWRWWAVFLFAVGYSVAGILTEIFDCTPVYFQWDIFAEGKCINRPAFYIANAVCNSVSDLLILALPIPVVWNLALTRRKKITLSLVFAMGSAGCIVSIIRLRSIIAYLQQGNGDLTFTITDFVVWSAIETMMSMVCTCVPTLKPLFETYFRGIFSGSTHDSKITGKYFRTDGRPTDHSRRASNLDAFYGDVELSGHKNKAQITANNVDSDTESTDEILSHRPTTIADHVVDDRGTNSIIISRSYQIKTTADR
ncbi:hypothetical protein E4T44_05081 [Aureobasidium sp. EXF-8845]|nr:hypothetical protein E4T44_05081 [Aureobasidium sp. EXF-8845]KAI4856567.1 hypothetical protein E4T45_01969 [Aureobasidium sp. EXF-8846]